MAATHTRRTPAPELRAMVFDDQHLRHYTMQDQLLAVEVLNLFLSQLPSTLELLQTASTKADAAFAAHALKGAAASVGAGRLQALAADLEAMDFPGDGQVRALRIQALQAAAVEFRDAARAAFPTLSRSAC